MPLLTSNLDASPSLAELGAPGILLPQIFYFFLWERGEEEEEERKE